MAWPRYNTVVGLRRHEWVKFIKALHFPATAMVPWVITAA